MNKVDQLATYLAESIHKNYPQGSSVAVLRYSLVAILNQLVIMCIVLAISILTGDFLPALVACFAFPLLKNYSGGMHLKSSQMCNIVTSIFILISVYLPISYLKTGYILDIISIIVLVINAPSGIKRSTLDKKYYPVLKLVAIAIVSTNFFFHSPTLSLVFVIQSLSTFRIVQTVIDRNNL